jgi:uncharacterized protein (TIGR02594 family)
MVTVRPQPQVPELPPWVNVALAEIGVLEAPGDADNPRIQEWHATTVGPKDVADAVPHCSSFINWVMLRCAIAGTRSKAARSWLTWGYKLDEPRIGAVCVLWRLSITGKKGHVGLYLGRNKNGVFLLGANQGNEVNVTRYPHKRVLGFFWPHSYPGVLEDEEDTLP